MLLKYKIYLLSAFCLSLVTIGFSAAIYSVDVAEPNLHQIRKLLVTAIDSKKTTDSLYTNLENMKERSALLNGYIGTLEALKAKHAWNPYFKVKYLNSSEKTFVKAVTRDPHNIEIRFMRFSIEHNVPGFLGYNKNLTSDRIEIIKQLDKQYYAQADKPLVKTIISFLIASERCTPTESTDLKKHLAAL